MTPFGSKMDLMYLYSKYYVLFFKLVYKDVKWGRDVVSVIFSKLVVNFKTFFK